MTGTFAFGKTYQSGTGCPAVEAGLWSEIPADGLGVIIRYDDILQHEADHWRGQIDAETAQGAFLQAIDEFEAAKVRWNRDMPPALDVERSLAWGVKVAEALGWERTSEPRVEVTA